MADLILPVKRVYFDSIKAGCKGEEYRLVTPYWSKRLVGREYDRVIITLGYPSAIDFERRLEFPWRGYRKTKITHPHFGPDDVTWCEVKADVMALIEAAPQSDAQQSVVK